MADFFMDALIGPSGPPSTSPQRLMDLPEYEGVVQRLRRVGVDDQTIESTLQEQEQRTLNAVQGAGAPQPAPGRMTMPAPPPLTQGRTAPPVGSGLDITGVLGQGLEALGLKPGPSSAGAAPTGQYSGSVPIDPATPPNEYLPMPPMGARSEAPSVPPIPQPGWDPLQTGAGMSPFLGQQAQLPPTMVPTRGSGPMPRGGGAPGAAAAAPIPGPPVAPPPGPSPGRGGAASMPPRMAPAGGGPGPSPRGARPAAAAVPESEPNWLDQTLGYKGLLDLGLRLMAASEGGQGPVGPSLFGVIGQAGLSHLDAERQKKAAEAAADWERQKFEKEQDLAEREFEAETAQDKAELEVKRAQVQADMELKRATLELKQQADERTAEIQRLRASIDAAQFETQKSRLGVEISNWERLQTESMMEADPLAIADEDKREKIKRTVRQEANQMREAAGLPKLGPKAAAAEEAPAGQPQEGKVVGDKRYRVKDGKLQVWGGP